MVKKYEANKEELEDQVEEETEEETEEDEEYEDLGPVIIGLSTGEKLIAELVDDTIENGCVTVYRPLRVIELVDGEQTQLRFATYNPFIVDQVLPIRAEHIVFLTGITDDAEDLYLDYCTEVDREERKLARQQQKQKKETSGKASSNVITAPFRKLPEKT